MFLELNSKGLYQSSGKEKENCCFVFTPTAKRENRKFHVVGYPGCQRLFMRAFRFRSSLKKCSVEKLYSRRFAARVLGLRRNTHRPAADETKLPVTREKKPLVPRVVVGVQRWQRNVQKYVMHVQNCCFAYLNLLLFCRFLFLHRRLCLSSLFSCVYVLHEMSL